jgi:hexulose-6-phosphate isomerase
MDPVFQGNHVVVKCDQTESNCMNVKSKIGFMQGRLSPLVDGRIQAFPWDTWAEEFPQAAACGIGLMEWTLDQEHLYKNPLLTSSGQVQIRELCSRHAMAIASLTGDCFMQAPFWKADSANAANLQKDFLAIVDACSAVGIEMIVVPLVDNGRLDTRAQEDTLVGFLLSQVEYFQARGSRVIFESDFAPAELARFISRLPKETFGINYDIGNSAALGFNPKEELEAYGNRIVNVHVKDRVLGGTTVPLGTGNAQFEVVFAELARLGYAGKFILQTARAADDSHAQTLCRYRDMTLAWMTRFGLPIAQS